jgi:beta-lactamase class C
MLGLITAKSMGEDFTALMETRLFPMLGMTNSYINVPESKMVDCAQGYTSQNTPIRMAPGLLSSEAYGIKTTASDMVHFLEANMNLVRLDKKLQRAVRETHTGYFKDGPMTQDLIWEQYKYPVALKSLLEGNSSAIIFNPTPVIKNTPPEKPRKDVWINKTGSTNGFGAYVAFVPKKQYAVVILANKNYPVEERVAAAYKIIAAIGDAQGRRRWGL